MAALSCAAQTNTPPDTTSQDLGKLLSDFGVKVDAGSLVVILLVVKAVAGYVRNFFLRDSTAEGASGLAKFVAHLAGSSLPSQPVVKNTLQPVVPESSTSAAGTTPPKTT